VCVCVQSSVSGASTDKVETTAVNCHIQQTVLCVSAGVVVIHTTSHSSLAIHTSTSLTDSVITTSAAIQQDVAVAVAVAVDLGASLCRLPPGGSTATYRYAANKLLHHYMIVVNSHFSTLDTTTMVQNLEDRT